MKTICRVRYRKEQSLRDEKASFYKGVPFFYSEDRYVAVLWTKKFNDCPMNPDEFCLRHGFVPLGETMYYLEK